MDERKRLYLAYGSNINLTQMKYRCPAAVPLMPAELKDYTLAFRGGGVATILPEKDSFVPCLLWSITPACEQSLDRYEGYPNLYHKEMVMLPLLNRCRAPAFATTRIRLFGISIWSSGCWKTNDIREKMDTRSSSRKNCLRGHS